MAEKTLNTRIQQKHDIELNWNKAINFIPKIGEIIVYDIDENCTYERFKIGDGVKTVVELPFTGITGLEISDDIVDLEGVNIIQNAHTLGGIAADQYALKSDLENIDLTNIDAVSLGGRAASEYALKFENWSDEEKTALVEYVFSAFTNANGVIF